MSRIGNNPVKLPAKVEVSLAAGEISVKGPLGTLSRTFGDAVTIEKSGEELVFKAANDESRALQGTLRALVANMVKGVTQGFERKLTLHGVGYRAQAAGDKINLSLGFSHPVVHTMPKGVKVADAGADGNRGHRASTSSRSGRSRRRSAPTVRPSRTRARECATPTSAW